MERCQAVHDLRKCRVEVGSPQTQTQREQVTRVVNTLLQSYKNTPLTATMTNESSLKADAIMPAALTTADKNNSSNNSSFRKVFTSSSLRSGAAGSSTSNDSLVYSSPSNTTIIGPGMLSAATSNSMTGKIPLDRQKSSESTIAAEEAERGDILGDLHDHTHNHPIVFLEEDNKTFSATTNTTIASESTVNDNYNSNTVPKRGVIRQSTENLNKILTTPVDPAVVEKISMVLTPLKQQQQSSAPLSAKKTTPILHSLQEVMSKDEFDDLPPPKEVLLVNTTSPLSASVTAAEVFDLQTGGSFIIHNPTGNSISRHNSSGSDHFLSPMISRDNYQLKDRDFSLGLKDVIQVADEDGDDDHEDKEQVEELDVRSRAMSITFDSSGGSPMAAASAARSQLQQHEGTEIDHQQVSQQNFQPRPSSGYNRKLPIDHHPHAQYLASQSGEEETSGGDEPERKKRVIPVPPVIAPRQQQQTGGVAQSSGRQLH